MPPLSQSQSTAAIPDHELIRCIGRGSYGQVWLARNVVGTYRAVKVVYRDTFDDNRPYEREYQGIQKFEPVSRTHDGLIDILQIGRNDSEGYFYYVMELADDANAECGTQRAELKTYIPKTLRSEAKGRGRLRVGECIEIVVSLASALDHLHKHGLVHRDIKPSNIILVQGVPKLADIGLVTSVDASRSYVGTEGFVPPEGPGTAQADIYSLGKVLYEISMGRDRTEFPKLPADSEAPLDELLELNAVICKACEPDLRLRYASAQDIRVDLESLAKGRSVLYIRRQRKTMTLVARLLAAGIVLGLLGWGAVSVTRRSDFASPSTPQTSRSAISAEAKKWFSAGEEARRKGTQDGFAEAVRCYNQALLLAPDYAPAYAGLGITYRGAADWHLPAKQVFLEAKRNVIRALELDPRSLVAYNELAWIYGQFERDFAASENAFKRAIALAPKKGEPHAGYGLLLIAVGRIADGEDQLTQALALAPKSSYVNSDRMWGFHNQRSYAQALEQCDRIQELFPEDLLIGFYRAINLRGQGKFEEALAALQQSRAAADGPDLLAYTIDLLGKLNRTDEARQLLAQLESESGRRYISPFYKAIAYLGVGEPEKAMDLLDEAFWENCGRLPDLAYHPEWDDLRSHPRFQAFLKKIALKQ